MKKTNNQFNLTQNYREKINKHKIHKIHKIETPYLINLQTSLQLNQSVNRSIILLTQTIITMHQHSLQQASSLLDEDEASSVKISKAQRMKGYQGQNKNKKKQKQQITEKEIRFLMKIAGGIGVVVVIMIVFLVLQLYGNSQFSLTTTDSSQQSPNLVHAQQQPQFDIQFKQKPIPSSPSQIPPQQPYNPPSGPNPWTQIQTNSSVKDKYFFKIPVQRMIQLSDPELFFGSNYKYHLQGLTEEQLQFSLNMLYVTHNVNHKGQINVQLAPYELDKQAKQTKIKQLLSAQQKIYQQKYQYQDYLKQQLPFCIVSPSYNNVHSKLYTRYIDSVFMQNYDNYHIVYVDDASPDKTGEMVMEYIRERGYPQEKIEMIVNKKNVYALENIYNAIHYHCNAGEIVMLIDGDDGLIGRQVFGLFNAVYQRTESALIYSNYLHVMYNQKALIGASSRPIPLNLLQRHGAIRSEHAFFTSHLLTFYVDMFRKIHKSDLTHQNGTFFKYAYDVAMCTPMLEMIGDRVFYLPELTYQYRYDTGQNDPGTGQMEVTALIYKKDVYEKLDALPFVDDRENYLKTAPKWSEKPKDNQKDENR